MRSSIHKGDIMREIVAGESLDAEWIDGGPMIQETRENH